MEGKEGSGFIEGAVLVADRGTRLLLEPSDAFPRPRAGSHGVSQVLISSKYDMGAYMAPLFGGETWDLC